MKVKLPVKIIIIGLAIALVVAGIGLFKQVDSKRINEERKTAALKKSQAMVDAANNKYSEIDKQLEPLKEKYETKRQECDSLKMSDPNWYADKTKCLREASSIDSQIDELEREQWKLKNADYTVYYQLVKPMSYQIFYIIGASIAGIALLGAFIIYLVKGKKTYE